MVRVLADTEWTEWLPIYCWLIDHEEGPILVDTGETSLTSDPSYFPWWHPYYRLSVEMDVSQEEEIGSRIRDLGLSPEDIGRVVLTHLHTDHAGGLHHFPKAEFLVGSEEFRSAKGVFGRMRGYLPHRWPNWFDPTPIPFRTEAVGPFPTSFQIVESGDVWAVPTPGHTPGHLSVVVQQEDVHFFLAGDTTYTQDLLLGGAVDGFSSDPTVSLDTLGRIRAYATETPTVYLPSHDPDSVDRLASRIPIPMALAHSSG